jgi:hypothetical protein
MSKKKLNLLQLTAIQMTQLGARPTKIMWCEIVQLRKRRRMAVWTWLKAERHS